jgi:DMSO/TMAO reductase YedYZ molybdopterin-dependent catalytic subunit
MAMSPQPVAAGSPIRKPLPPEWFDRFGTNAETRWDSLAEVGDTVPNERFFVRNHSATPAIDPATWRLRIFGDGLTGEAAELSLSELERLPSTSLTACIECAGNGRSFFAGQQGTPAPGTQWALGGVGVADWRGVLLAEVLERAGIARSAVDVLPEGLDANVVSGGVDLGKVRRPLPVDKALDDVLLAYEMNGAELPPDHGFPVRLVVPGWVGIASIKWLGRIDVSTRPLSSPWSTTSYRMFGPDYPADSPPLTSQPVKSALELARGAVLPVARPTTLTGRAWSGTAAIRRVEVSIDRGATWAEAELFGTNLPGAWARWRLEVEPRSSGQHEIWVRATDEHGRSQPPSVPFNTFGYLYSAVVRHPVVVRDVH